MSRFDAALLQRALRAAGLASAEPVPQAAAAAAPAPLPGDLVAQALPLVAALCRRFEGFSAVPYLCPAGVPTIGYGATYYADGRAVRLSDRAITRDEADALLLATLRRDFVPAVLRLCARADTPGRLAALADFAFNLGQSRLAASTLRRRVAAADWAGARVELLKWVYGGGKRLRGLELRRGAEAQLL